MTIIIIKTIIIMNATQRTIVLSLEYNRTQLWESEQSGYSTEAIITKATILH